MEYDKHLLPYGFEWMDKNLKDKWINELNTRDASKVGSVYEQHMYDHFNLVWVYNTKNGGVPTYKEISDHQSCTHLMKSKIKRDTQTLCHIVHSLNDVQIPPELQHGH